MKENQLTQRLLKYGEHADQCMTLSEVPGRKALGTAVLVHGGYWRQRITAAVMQPMVEALLDAGWNVANVEYRRGAAHPWPIPSMDVANAITELRRSFEHQAAANPLVLIGHSVGGQLALLNAELADAVIGLAPVTDVARVFEDDLGESAALEYFDHSMLTDQDFYQRCSPVRDPAPTVPMLLVHGENDDRVPLEHTNRYIEYLGNLDTLTTKIHPRLDHFEIIDPKQLHWATVQRWMEQLSVNARSK